MIPITSYEEAISVANDTSYGLAASVFTRNASAPSAPAHDIRAGTVTVNTHGEGDITTPFGGSVLRSPFVLGGANTPASTAPAVAQLNAKALSAVAYTQVIRRGCSTATTSRPSLWLPARRWPACPRSA